MKAILYSASWCSNCPAAKKTLDTLGVEYTVIDIDDNPEAAQAAGIRGIPTIFTEDGEMYTTATLPKLKERLQTA